MKITKLIVDYDYSFILAAIICPVKEFRLAWYLNHCLGIDLSKSTDLEYNFVKQGKILISNFLFESEYTTFRLLKNKACESINTQKPFLVPELKEYDFFLQVVGEIDTIDTNDFFSKLKSTEVIQYVESINVENLKSKDNFIID